MMEKVRSFISNYSTPEYLQIFDICLFAELLKPNDPNLCALLRLFFTFRDWENK